MSVTKQNEAKPPWLLLVFSLARKGASLRVTVWRKLQRHGALPLGNSGYFLPNTEENRERFEWLATAVRTEGGDASVLEVQSIDNCSFEQMKQRFSDARAEDYRELLKELRNPASANQSSRITRLRQRFQDIVSIDFFGSPLREQVERALNAMQTSKTKSAAPEIGKVSPAEYRNRVWVTRPRPGVDRVTSAWLIRKFIDPKAKFAFAPEDKKPPRPSRSTCTKVGLGTVARTVLLRRCSRCFTFATRRFWSWRKWFMMRTSSMRNLVGKKASESTK